MRKILIALLFSIGLSAQTFDFSCVELNHENIIIVGEGIVSIDLLDNGGISLLAVPATNWNFRGFYNSRTGLLLTNTNINRPPTVDLTDYVAHFRHDDGWVPSVILNLPETLYYGEPFDAMITTTPWDVVLNEYRTHTSIGISGHNFTRIGSGSLTPCALPEYCGDTQYIRRVAFNRLGNIGIKAYTQINNQNTFSPMQYVRIITRERDGWEIATGTTRRDCGEGRYGISNYGTIPHYVKDGIIISQAGSNTFRFSTERRGDCNIQLRNIGKLIGEWEDAAALAEVNAELYNTDPTISSNFNSVEGNSPVKLASWGTPVFNYNNSRPSDCATLTYELQRLDGGVYVTIDTITECVNNGIHGATFTTNSDILGVYMQSVAFRIKIRDNESDVWFTPVRTIRFN